MIIANKEKYYRQLKESIRMKKSQRSDTEKKIWLEKVKTGIDEIMNCNEIINNSLKSQI